MTEQQVSKKNEYVVIDVAGKRNNPVPGKKDRSRKKQQRYGGSERYQRLKNRSRW